MFSRTSSTIVCSTYLTHSLSCDDTMYSFGCSSTGAHGHEEECVFPPKIIPLLKNIKSISVGGAHAVCLDNDANIFTFGNNEWGQLGIGVDKDTVVSTHIPQKVNLPRYNVFN